MSKTKTSFDELLKAGVHFGHLTRKWNPKMAPYIFMERNGIHIIDLQKTIVKLEEASSAIKQIAKSGRKILFVATKKQAKDLVAERIKLTGMPYVTERWPGGMLTNFPTIRKAVKKMATIDRMLSDGTAKNLAKRERLQITRQREKLERNLGSISDLTRLPAAIFVVDISTEHIAVREATRLNIPIFGIVDTNSNPNEVDFPIPANDDASKSISILVDAVATAVEEGLEERKFEKKDDSYKETKTKGKEEKKADAPSVADAGKEEKTEKAEKPEKKTPAKKAVAKKEDKKEAKPSEEKAEKKEKTATAKKETKKAEKK